MEIFKTPAGRIVCATTVPVLCLDLDGTVRYSKTGEFITGPDDIAIFPDVDAKLWEFHNKGFVFMGISNQGGVAFGYKTPEQSQAELVRTAEMLAAERPFRMILRSCSHHPDGTVAPFNVRSLCRKPDYGMLALMEVELFHEGYIVDWDRSLFVGDRPEDKECARQADIQFEWANDFFGRANDFLERANGG